MPRLRYIGGSRYALRDGPTWTEGDVHDIDGVTADRLAGLDKFELVGDDSGSGEDATDTVSVADMVEMGECPWCPPDDRYEGDHVGQHASSAHADEWAAYKGGR